MMRAPEGSGMGPLMLPVTSLAMVAAGVARRSRRRKGVIVRRCLGWGSVGKTWSP